MVARALCGCGLDLGDELELLGPTEHNEHGHWEPEAFVPVADDPSAGSARDGRSVRRRRRLGAVERATRFCMQGCKG
jgi:hypothetical protein